MSQKSGNSRRMERTLIAVIFVLLLFLSPLSNYWAALDAVWYTPYIAWALAIVVSWWLQRYLKNNDL